MIWHGDLEMFPCHIPSPTKELVHNGATFTKRDRSYQQECGDRKRKKLLTHSNFFSYIQI